MSDRDDSTIEARLEKIERIVSRILALQELIDPTGETAALGTKSTYSAPCSTKSIGTACNIGGAAGTLTAAAGAR